MVMHVRRPRLVLCHCQCFGDVAVNAQNQFGDDRTLVVLVSAGNTRFDAAKLPKGTKTVRVYPNGQADEDLDLGRDDVCVLSGSDEALVCALFRWNMGGSHCRVLRFLNGHFLEMLPAVPRGKE